MRIPDAVQRAWERFRFRSRKVGAAVQTVVVTVLLFFVYVLGLGLTRLVASVFARRHLAPFGPGDARESYWLPAEGYDASETNLGKQV